MTDAVITSLGLLSPIGFGRESFVDAWRTGVVAERLVEGEDAGGVVVPKFKASKLYPDHRKSLRRMDRLSKLICSAVALVRDDDAGLGERENLALSIGTDFGTLTETWKFVSRLKAKGPALCNPMDFPNLVPNAGAGYAGMFLQLRGPCHTFCQHEVCGDEAAAWVHEIMQAGWVDAGVAGGAEELGGTRARATRVARGWSDAEAPAEGAAAFLMETPGRAAARGATPRARYLGCRGAAQPSHRSALRAPEDVSRLVDLIRESLDATGVAAADVGAVALSHPTLAPLQAAVTEALGRAVPSTDHHRRVGCHPADGAFRVALAALLLADRSLPVHADGDALDGSAALVVTCARGGALRVTVLGEV